MGCILFWRCFMSADRFDTSAPQYWATFAVADSTEREVPKIGGYCRTFVPDADGTLAMTDATDNDFTMVVKGGAQYVAHIKIFKATGTTGIANVAIGG